MKIQSFFVLFATLLLFGLTGRPLYSLQATQPPAAAGPTLVFVTLPATDRDRLPEDGLTIFAQVNGRTQPGLIGGASAAALSELAHSGLVYRALESIPPGANYYLATLRPGQPSPVWGQAVVLLAEADWWLVRATPETANELAGQGVDLRHVTFDPKPRGWATAVTAPTFPTVIDPDPTIQAMIDQITSDTVAFYDGNLSGEAPVDIGGSPYTIVSRHTFSGTPIQKATQYVGEYFANLGLPVEYHQWGGATYPNVIAEITGQVNPDDIYILSAHLDNMPPGALARGADDNASGVVAALLAADLFSEYEWGCTLRFGLWTGEEQGLDGSAVYAQRAFNQGDNIRGVLNLDMIAWNTPNSSRDIDLHSSTGVPGSQAIAQTFVDVINAYNLDLIPAIVPNGSSASDHASFWDYGYPAIMGIEDFSDFNPYYHTVNDRLSNLDLEYFTEFTRASVATFAHLTGCLMAEDGSVAGHVTAADGGEPIAEATVMLQASGGEEFTAVTDPTGYYTQTLPGNTYTATVRADGYLPAIVPGVVITSGITTTLDMALDVACESITAVTLAAAPNPPLYAGDTVTFTLGIVPDTAVLPFTYTLSVSNTIIANDQSASAPVIITHAFPAAGDYTVAATAWNCDPATAVANTLDFTILPANDRFRTYLPTIWRAPSGK